MWNIFKYIINNNPWYAIPYRLLIAFGYQLYKRIVQRTFIKSLPNGKQIAIFPFSPNASMFMYTPIPDKTEINLLRGLVDANTIFLDVGANLGDYSVMLMDRVKEIYAFEAHPKTAQLCKINFLLNGVDENRVIAKAVSDKVQEVYFSNLPNGSPVNSCLKSNNENSHQSAQRISVSAITLDSFIQTLDIHSATNFIIKIDVEGFEREVLLGAKALLTEHRVSGIVLERFSEDFKAIRELLEKWGYAIKPISTNNVFCYPTKRNDYNEI